MTVILVGPKIARKTWSSRLRQKTDITDGPRPKASHASNKTIKQHECNTDEDSVMSVDSQFHFQLENGDWEIFMEKMECYLLTKNITEDKLKVATLATRLGDDAHALLKQLVAPEKITTKKYEELIKAMTDQLAPTPSEAMERCTFHTAKQESKETVVEFVA